MGFFASTPRWYRLGTALVLLWALVWCGMVLADVPLAPVYWGKPPSEQARYWVETPYAIRSAYILWTQFTLLGGLLLLLRRKAASLCLTVALAALAMVLIYLQASLPILSRAFLVQALIGLVLLIVATAFVILAMHAQGRRWMR